MVPGFYGDSLASTCASEGSHSLMGGSTIVTWSLRVDLPADGKVLGRVVLAGDCCTLHFLYIMVDNGGLSLLLLLNGPTPAM